MFQTGKAPLEQLTVRILVGISTGNGGRLDQPLLLNNYVPRASKATEARFLRHSRSYLTRSLGKIKYELGAT